MAGTSRSVFLVARQWALVLLSVASFGAIASSIEVSNTTDDCSDLLMLFARGSSSNPNGLNVNKPFSKEFEEGVPDPLDPSKTVGAEEIPGSFFRWMEKRIKADYHHIDYKAVSVHYSDKGYSQNGYPAVGIFNPDTIGNALQAKFSWWKAGEYTDSVSSGSQELAGYVRESSINCPKQRIIIGGYSQGAQVVHESLKIIPQNERNLIDNVVLFGDPKFIGSDYSKYNLLDKPKAYPWHRGTAGLRERGLGGAEIPYVSADMWRKTISWCHEDDFVCTGMSGLSWAVTNHEMPGNDHSIWSGPEGAFGDGHTRYPVFGVPESTGEVMENLRTHLSALEVSRGGLDPKTNPYQRVYDTSLVNDRPIDLMFALNYTGGNEDAMAQYLLNLKNITKQYKKNFTQMNTGGLMYTDLGGNVNLANTSYLAGYAKQANQLSSNMDNAFNGTVYFGGGMGGGGDYPENHGMLIERGGMFASWRPSATKHLVIFAERPAHEGYSFNICSPTTINSLPHTGDTPCIFGAKYLSKERPEWCTSVLEVISFDVCNFGGPTTNTKIISRSLSDAIILARAKGFVVDVVQPHTARSTQPAPYTPLYVETQLKTLAESTGGLYLKYGVFDEPAMRDAIWQILNHQPKIMSLAQYSPGSLLDFADTKLSPQPLLGPAIIPSGKSTLLTTTPVSGAQSYGWDYNSDGTTDDLSDGPTTERTFDQGQGIVTVRAFASSAGTGQVSARVLPFQTASSESLEYTETDLDGLSGLVATRQDGSSDTVITWDIPIQASDKGIVIIKDTASGIILQSGPVGDGSLTVVSPIDSYLVQYIDNGGEADPQSVNVTIIYPQPAPDPRSNVGQNEDKVVTQDEPNTTQDPNSPAIDTTPDEPVVVARPASSPSPASSFAAPVTAVAAVQDVKETPKSEIGGIKEANELFTDENLGQNPEPVEDGPNLLVTIGLGGLVLLCILFAVILLKKKNQDDE